MNFISAFIDGIVGFVRRNQLTCVILLLIAVVAPSLFGFMLYVILGMVLVSIISGTDLRMAPAPHAASDGGAVPPT